MTAVVSATPGTGVSGSILAKGTSPDGIVVSSRGTTDVTRTRDHHRPRRLDRLALPRRHENGCREPPGHNKLRRDIGNGLRACGDREYQGVGGALAKGAYIVRTM